MSRKHTIEYVKEYYENEEWEYLDDEYLSNSYKHLVKCPGGHEQYKSFSNFKQGKRCSICTGNKKHTIEYVKEYYNNKNWVYLDNNYINNKTKHLCKCPVGHIQYKSFDSLKCGNGCLVCECQIKYTIEYVKEYYEKAGWQCIENEYIHSNVKMLVRCPNGHLQHKKFNDFKNNKTRCKKCYDISKSGKNNYNWNPDRTRTRRLDFLRFDKRKKYILKNDLNYNDYLNEKELYNIDHIFPRVAFIDNDLDKKYDINIVKKICNSIENLQIITKEENLCKHAKYDQDKFMKWFYDKLKTFEKYKDIEV